MCDRFRIYCFVLGVSRQSRASGSPLRWDFVPSFNDTGFESRFATSSPGRPDLRFTSLHEVRYGLEAGI
jgi:hypothetical protein